MWLASLVACNPAGRADDRLAEGRPADAVALYARAGELSEPQRQRYARALLQVGRADEAGEQLVGVELDANGFLVQGALQARAGDLEAALVSFDAGFAHTPLPELAHDVCTTRLALDEPALPECGQAVQMNPTSALAYAALADAAQRAGADQAAREALAAAATHRAQEPDAGTWIAEVWLRLGEAEAACAQADVATGLAVGLGCLQAGELDRAARLLEPYGDSDPVAAAAMLRLRVEQVEQLPGSAAQAVAIERARRWDRALQASTDGRVLYDRGRLERADGAPLAAEDLWTQAVAQAPCAPEPLLALADSRSRRGQPAAETLRAGLDGCSVPFFQQVVSDALAALDSDVSGE